jgi:antitoxin (DNA-binding transcriptional repressor) of toxin-antitoxin stability system
MGDLFEVILGHEDSASRTIEDTPMNTITLQEAQTRLSELIHRLTPGEEVIITEDDQPVARLTLATPTERKPRQLGTLKGTVLHMAPDFDEPIDDFKESME